MLVKYIYLSEQDEEDIRSLWQGLAQEGEQIEVFGLDFEQRSAHFALGCVQKAQAPQYNRYLYLYNKMAIIVIEEENINSQEKLIETLTYVNEKLAAVEVIGHSTLLVNPDIDLLNSYKEHLSINNSSNIALLNGVLNFFTYELQDFHQILTYSGEYSKDTFLKELPVLLANIFSLTQKVQFYRDQKHTISFEKTELDKKITSMMQLNFLNIENQKSKLVHLEELTNELANIYTTLSANASVLLNNQLVLEKDNHVCSRQFRKLLKDTDNFLKERYLQPCEELIKDITSLTKQLQISINNAKTSIDILQTQINLIRSNDNVIIQNQMRQVMNQNLELQQEALTLQVGAGLIEFIVVMYYSLSIWKTLAPESLHDIPGGLKFGIFFVFSALIVWVTHKVSTYVIKKKNKAHD